MAAPTGGSKGTFMKLRIGVLSILSLATLCGGISSALAQETTTYTYDAKGRVTGTQRSGGPSSGATTTYTYDGADNRTNVTVTNSPNGSGNGSGNGASAPAMQYVVVPLNGYTLIAFAQ